MIDGGEVISPLSERILGRTSAIDMKHPLTGEVVVGAGELIDEALVERSSRPASTRC